MRCFPTVIILSLALLPLAVQHAHAAQAFQVWGGISDGSTAITRDSQDGEIAGDEMRSRIVDFGSDLPAGSITVKTAARLLYFILPDGKAIQYQVGVGREGFTWSGTERVSRKAEWPDWRPPPAMIARERRKGRDLASFVPGGPDNPLGARAIYIGSTDFRIHGTNQAWSIGKAMSSGCIRMMNADVIDLYGRVALGATVRVEE